MIVMKYKKSSPVLILVNLVILAPAIVLYYTVRPNDPNIAGDEGLGTLFNLLVIPAIIVVLVDIMYVLKYTRRQTMIAKKSPSHKRPPQPVWIRVGRSRLFWFNIFTVIPCVALLLDLVLTDGAGSNLGLALGIPFLVPLAIGTILFDIYYLSKYLSKP